jgi:hypothetical protein
MTWIPTQWIVEGVCEWLVEEVLLNLSIRALETDLLAMRLVYL